MIKYFANNEPLVLIFIPLMVLGHLFLDIYFPSFELLAEGQENLWDVDFHAIPNWISRVGAFVFVCINAFLVNRLFNTHEFYERNVYLPSLIYILLIFLFPMSLRMGEDLIGHTFFILSLHQLLNIKQNEDARKQVFLSGLFIGLATSFLPIYIYFLLFMWASLLTIRPFVFREVILPVFGVLISHVWLFLIDPFFFESYITFESKLNYARYGNIALLIPHVVVLLLVLLGNKKVLDRRAKSSIRYKRILNMIVYTLLFSILAGALIMVLFDSYFYFTIGAVVLCIILPYAYLEVKKKWIPAGLLYVLLVLNIIKFFYS